MTLSIWRRRRRHPHHRHPYPVVSVIAVSVGASTELRRPSSLVTKSQNNIIADGPTAHGRLPTIVATNSSRRRRESAAAFAGAYSRVDTIRRRRRRTQSKDNPRAFATTSSVADADAAATAASGIDFTSSSRSTGCRRYDSPIDALHRPRLFLLLPLLLPRQR